MALRVVDDAQLTAIADAIREKNGTSAKTTLSAMPDKIKNLKGEDIIKHSDIPDYVKSAMLDVIEKVKAARKKDSFVFMAMSDPHHIGAQDFADQTPEIRVNTGNYHACMAAKILSYALEVDFNCLLGDVAAGHGTTTAAELKQQLEEFNSYIDEAYNGVPQFRTVGNHDTGQYNTLVGADYLFSVIGKYCEGATYGKDKYGSTKYGYCYRDFTSGDGSKHLRVICLNSCEGETESGSEALQAMSDEQLKWFAQTLYDVGSKGDASDWSVMVLSHFPLDFSAYKMYKASDIVKAYVEGTSTTQGGTVFNFNGHNGAKFVANMHGHVHCFKVDKLYTTQNGVSTKYDAWRFCVPSTNHIGSEKHYSGNGIVWNEDVVYNKTWNSYKDTSFVVNVMNPSDEVIHSFCYGAGPEEPRLISYGAATHYSISYDLTYTTSTETAVDIMENEPFTTTLTANDGYELSNVVVTMGGVDITSTVYSDGVVNIPSVTGNISITATATVVTSYTNQLLIAGYEKGQLGSNGAEANSDTYYRTGFIPLKVGQTVRLKNVGYNKNGYATTGAGNFRRCFYDGDKAFLYQGGAASTYGYGTITYDDDGNWTEFTLKSTSNAASSSVVYFRMSCHYLGEDSIITVDEPIE